MYWRVWGTWQTFTYNWFDVCRVSKCSHSPLHRVHINWAEETRKKNRYRPWQRYDQKIPLTAWLFYRLQNLPTWKEICPMYRIMNVRWICIQRWSGHCTDGWGNKVLYCYCTSYCWLEKKHIAAPPAVANKH